MTDDSLRERVRELEETVSEQQETIAELQSGGPTRRDLVAGAGGVAAGGGLLALLTGSASAQAAGQVGTASSPVDAFAYNLDVANGVTSALAMNGNDIQNAGSVITADIGNGGSPVSLSDYLTRDTSSSTAFFAGGSSDEMANSNVVVDTTPATILDYRNDGILHAAASGLVYGEDGNVNRFLDFVLLMGGEGVTTVGSVTRGSPASRTYSSGTDAALTLQMGSGSYAVTAAGKSIISDNSII